MRRRAQVFHRTGHATVGTNDLTDDFLKENDGLVEMLVERARVLSLSLSCGGPIVGSCAERRQGTSRFKGRDVASHEGDNVDPDRDVLQGEAQRSVEPDERAFKDYQPTLHGLAGKSWT